MGEPRPEASGPYEDPQVVTIVVDKKSDKENVVVQVVKPSQARGRMQELRTQHPDGVVMGFFGINLLKVEE